MELRAEIFVVSKFIQRSLKRPFSYDRWPVMFSNSPVKSSFWNRFHVAPLCLLALCCQNPSWQSNIKGNNVVSLSKKDRAVAAQALQVPTAFLSKAPAVTHQPQLAKDTDNDSHFFLLLFLSSVWKQGHEFYTESINLWHADKHLLP